LYKLPDNNQVPAQNFNIENFLGECADHPDIVNSKINENEKNILDRPLGIEELDRSIKKAKKNTSPGGDGISNRFIEKNWNLFRVPLFKYANLCFEKGQLTDNFRSANVKLIPKKGDCTRTFIFKFHNNTAGYNLWLGIGKLQFLIIKMSTVIFFQFLVIKALDPDWILIRIRIGVHPKMLDPDPEKINTDPQPCKKKEPGMSLCIEKVMKLAKHVRCLYSSFHVSLACMTGYYVVSNP
jgi:hypothetical protein